MLLVSVLFVAMGAMELVPTVKQYFWELGVAHDVTINKEHLIGDLFNYLIHFVSI
jgi:hypothetical protein